jgi:hypothetical protein
MQPRRRTRAAEQPEARGPSRDGEPEPHRLGLAVGAHKGADQRRGSEESREYTRAELFQRAAAVEAAGNGRRRGWRRRRHRTRTGEVA